MFIIKGPQQNNKKMVYKEEFEKHAYGHCKQ